MSGRFRIFQNRIQNISCLQAKPMKIKAVFCMSTYYFLRDKNREAQKIIILRSNKGVGFPFGSLLHILTKLRDGYT